MIIRALSPRPTAVADLARLTGASAVTIRRDLTDLEGHGLLRRVHGGAVALDLRGTPMPYAIRAAENADAKAAVAAVVADLVQDEMSLVLDNGSTLVAVAQALAGRPITALCLSLRTAAALGAASPPPTIVTPGGAATGESLDYGGAACLSALEDYRADLAVLGACAASPAHGLTATTSEDAEIKRAVIRSAARVVLAATGDKVRRTSSFRVGPLEEIDDLVTTPDAPESALEEIRAAGVQVHLAR